MDQKIKIAVIGGGGRTGRFLVDQLLNQGFSIKLLLRNPENQLHTFAEKSAQIEIVRGDVLDIDAVRLLLKGCGAVFSTVGQRPGEPLVASRATTNILEAIPGISDSSDHIRYILLAGINVDTPFDKKGTETLAATAWMKTHFPEIHQDRQKAYEILAKSQAAWTLVRVPFIEFVEKKKAVSVCLEDSPGSRISAGGIAEFMIAQLTDASFVHKSPFIAETEV
jgi:putative NADH-flavin reductase